MIKPIKIRAVGTPGVFERLARLCIACYPWKRGATRLFDFLRRRLQGVTLFRGRNGILYLLNLDNLIDVYIYTKGAYEPESSAILCELSRRNSCAIFIDVGANIGVHSMCLARVAGVETVHAFEPDPRNRAQLSANLWLNGLQERVKIWENALADTTGVLPFWLAPAGRRSRGVQHNTMLSGLSSRGEGMEGAWIDVNVCPLDSLLHYKGERLLIKVDVEGHEYEVLRGMSRLLDQNDCVLAIEVWDHAKESGEKIVNILAGHGYHPMPVRAGENRFFAREPKLSSC